MGEIDHDLRSFTRKPRSLAVRLGAAAVIVFLAALVSGGMYMMATRGRIPTREVLFDELGHSLPLFGLVFFLTLVLVARHLPRGLIESIGAAWSYFAAVWWTMLGVEVVLAALWALGSSSREPGFASAVVSIVAVSAGSAVLVTTWKWMRWATPSPRALVGLALAPIVLFAIDLRIPGWRGDLIAMAVVAAVVAYCVYGIRRSGTSSR